MRPFCRRSHAFTMIELLTVIIIISIIAAFGVPSFNRTIVRTRARDAINNLAVIQAAQQLYFSRTGVYLRADTLQEINTGLSLNLVASGGTVFTCNDTLTPAPPTSCGAVSVAGTIAFRVLVVLGDGSNPVCTPTAGGCP